NLTIVSSYACAGSDRNTRCQLRVVGSKEALDENHNCYPRRSFPRRHSGSCYVSEVICAWASSCEGSSRSFVFRAWPHEAPAHAECAHVRTGSYEALTY